MSRAIVNTHAASLPGAAPSDPWGDGHDAWKLGGKRFAVVGAAKSGVPAKCSDTETAALLTGMGRAKPAPYFHKSGVCIPWGLVEKAELRERISISCRFIHVWPPRKVQARLASDISEAWT